jgi:hypothetical protein
MISRVENFVKNELKDPDSAKFKNLIAGKFSDGRIAVCGEVNSKNSFGGYTGFTLFMVRVSASDELESGGFGDDEFFTSFIDRTCIPVRVANGK